MGKYTNSIFTPNQRGRLGGVVFSKNKYGQYLKMLGIPSNPKTIFQMNRRASLAELTRYWASLTTAQRLSWNSQSGIIQFVNMGESYTLSGFALFTKCNSNLQIVNQPIVEEMQTVLYPSPVGDFSAAIVTTPGSEAMTLTIGNPIAAGERAIIMASPKNLKPGKQIPDTAMRVIAVLDNTFVSGGSIMTQYLAKFGTMPGTGQQAKFAIKKVATASGYEGLEFTDIAVGAV